jgi:hypothetical protein
MKSISVIPTSNRASPSSVHTLTHSLAPSLAHTLFLIVSSLRSAQHMKCLVYRK